MKPLLRWVGLVVLAALALQLFFVLRIAALVAIDPQSTTFQRSEAWAQLSTTGRVRWKQEWVPYDQISDHLKRAVIASEDADFAHHGGVEWEAIEKARMRNARAEARAEERAARLAAAASRKKAATAASAPAAATKPPKIVGGSTITQQLAKNLLLSGERTLLRKGQEFVLTQALELLLSKERILEIYLNSVEWGDGVFGAEAAAQHYYRKPAAKLSANEAARLAVMLPRPKYFEKLPNSGYLASRAATITARMGSAELP